MRILVLSNLYPSPLHPGFGTFVAARVDALRSAGAQVDVVAIHDPAARSRVVPKYASLGVRSIAYAVRSRARRQRVDVVEAHIAFPTGLLARPVAALLAAPLVLFAHGADVLEVPTRTRLHRALARVTYEGADLVVANSEFLASELRRAFPRISRSVVVISPGIEFARFASPDRADERRRRGVLFVGRLIPEKGCDVLFRAMARLPPTLAAAPLTILGDGPQRRALEGLAEELGIEVAFFGPAGRDVVAEAMRSAALLVVPSVYREPLGLVALEAMAAGAIVVASSTGGLSEIVADGQNGLTVPPGDAGPLAEAIKRGLSIATDPVAGPRVRTAARHTAEGHDIRVIAADSLRLYGTLRP